MKLIRMLRSFRNQHPTLSKLLILAVCFFTLARFILFTTAWDSMTRIEGPFAFIVGFYFDFLVTLLILSPFGFISSLLPTRLHPFSRFRIVRFTGLSIFLFFLSFITLSEIVFWFEFHTRMNFIAVDYLLYTHEVIGNIRQSYPMGAIFSGLGALAIVLSYFLTRKPSGIQQRRRSHAFVFSVLFIASYFGINIDIMEWSKNTVSNELSGNGLVTFFAALRRNDLDYNQFYITMDQKRADLLIQTLGVERPMLSDFPGVKVPQNPEVFDALPFKKRPKNVVLISVESLSASFLGPRGNAPSLTPNLDRLKKESLVFDRFFATGTRTVRGLEALSLGIPPIPGQSVVRRPENGDLTTLGGLLSNQGFIPYFIYGGYGYFDNMNAYFEANHYKVIDRKDFPTESIPFENIWGVADEALYTNALSALDQAQTANKPFFAHLMTTSNHRPYTYPDGRIDIPSPGGRDGAVKYTDYAIGFFLEQSKKHSWFSDTLFIITADHCASVAGKTKLPVDQYRIPLYFYGPEIVKPGVRHDLVSQLDIPPTVMEALRIEGDDYFFGRSLFQKSATAPRAFLSNYQTLGYYKNDILTVLMPQRRVQAYRVHPNTFVSTLTEVDPVLRDEAVAFYQTAALAFKQGAMKGPRRIALTNAQ